jgi:hypothetical protein
VPVLRTLAGGGFQGPALGDLGYRGERLANVGEALGISVEAIARGRDGRFAPAGICWVVERSLAWLSRYRRLNTIFERSKEHLIAFVAIAFISILSLRLKRLAAEELSALRLQTATNTETRKSVDYHAGDFILETIGHWHHAQNIGNEPIRLVVIDQVEKGRENTVCGSRTK